MKIYIDQESGELVFGGGFGGQFEGRKIRKTGVNYYDKSPHCAKHYPSIQNRDSGLILFKTIEGVLSHALKEEKGFIHRAKSGFWYCERY